MEMSYLVFNYFFTFLTSTYYTTGDIFGKSMIFLILTHNYLPSAVTQLH